MSNERQALLQAVAAQQKQIRFLAHQNAVQGLQLAYVAKLAGVSKQVEAIKKKADAENPGQPVPNPPSEPAVLPSSARICSGVVTSSRGAGCAARASAMSRG